MRKIVIISAIMLWTTVVKAQNYDTLQTYPYIYCYNCPDTTQHHDSIACELTEGMIFPWDDQQVAYGTRVAILQHTDTPLRVAGMAFTDNYPDPHNRHRDYRLGELTIYDSNMTVLMRGMTSLIPITDSFNYDVAGWDTVIYKKFILPGYVAPDMGTFTHSIGFTCYPPQDFDILLKAYYFDSKKTIEVNGDFWIGYSRYTPSDQINWVGSNLYFIRENHEPPYRIDTINYRVFMNDEWVDFTLDGGILPELFLILEPECHGVEGVTATMDTAGCVDVVWDSLDGQTQWQVFLQGPGVSVTDTIASCHWRYCGLDPNATYTVSVSTRCNGPQGNFWSDWSDPEILGIADIENSNLKVDITPNPASGMVEVRCSEPMALLELFNAAGDKVFSQSLSTTHYQLSTTNYPSGAYLVRITTPQGVATRKLMKR